MCTTSVLSSPGTLAIILCNLAIDISDGITHLGLGFSLFLLGVRHHPQENQYLHHSQIQDYWSLSC